MKRKHKRYSRPKRPFDKARIIEEGEIKDNFGLKNKKEIWKAEAKVKSFREKAKKAISATEEEKQVLFNKLKKIGINVSSIADVLSLDKRDYLKRRLQTVLVSKKLATTPKGARQLITHKNVLVDGRVVNSPSYAVPVEFENKISLKMKKKKISNEKSPVEFEKIADENANPENPAEEMGAIAQ
ncbi:MAG: 30S ribosomal protein S4 [Nanoarchaeota archaeon]